MAGAIVVLRISKNDFLKYNHYKSICFYVGKSELRSRAADLAFAGFWSDYFGGKLGAQD